MTTTCSFSLEGSPLDRASGRISEISETGLFIAANSLWPPRTRLALVIDIPGERLPLRLSGEVTWARTRGASGMFVTFGGDPPARERLARIAAFPAPPR